MSGGHLYEVEAPTEAAAEIGALDIPLFNSLHLMREVDFAKQKTEGEKNESKISNNCFSPSVSLALNSSLVRGSHNRCMVAGQFKNVFVRISVNI